MSIMAVIAAPLGQVIYFREKEIQLKLHLRKIREAIDKFYADNGHAVLWNLEKQRPWKEGDVTDPNLKVKYQTVRWIGRYPTSWAELYEGYLRKSFAINPMTNIAEDWSVVVSYPPKPDENATPEERYWYDAINVYFTKEYPRDFTYSPAEWLSEEFLDVYKYAQSRGHVGPDGKILPNVKHLYIQSGMWDVHYPYHEQAIDGTSYYDQW